MKMHYLFSLVVLLSSTSMVADARAEDFALSAHPTLRFAAREWSEDTAPGVGVLFTGRFELTSRLSLTLRSGFIRGMDESRIEPDPFFEGDRQIWVWTNELPALFGGRVLLSEGTRAPFLSVEGGVMRFARTSIPVEADRPAVAVLPTVLLGGGMKFDDLTTQLSVFWSSNFDGPSRFGVWLTMGFDILSY